MKQIEEKMAKFAGVKFEYKPPTVAQNKKRGQSEPATQEHVQQVLDLIKTLRLVVADVKEEVADVKKDVTQVKEQLMEVQEDVSDIKCEMAMQNKQIQEVQNLYLGLQHKMESKELEEKKQQKKREKKQKMKQIERELKML